MSELWGPEPTGGIELGRIHVIITRDGQDVTEEFFPPVSPTGFRRPYFSFLPTTNLHLTPLVNQILSAFYVKQMTSKQLMEEQYDVFVSLTPVLPPYIDTLGQQKNPNEGKPKSLYLTFIKGHAFLTSDCFDSVQLPLTSPSLLSLARAHPVQRAVAALRIESASPMSPLRVDSSVPFADIIPLASEGRPKVSKGAIVGSEPNCTTEEANRLISDAIRVGWGSTDIGAPRGLGLNQERPFSWYEEVVEGSDSIINTILFTHGTTSLRDAKISYVDSP